MTAGSPNPSPPLPSVATDASAYPPVGSVVTPHYVDDLVTLHHGDCLDIMRSLPDASVDAVVTDPPYGLGFMGKEWDRPGSAARGYKTDVDLAVNPYSRARAEYGGTSYGREVAGLPFQKWCETWLRECLRVLKPGGHLLTFGGTRTWHRLACAVEDAGFEMRDSIAWLYGSGFPKSRNLDGDWQGWGTALKPAFEPIVVGRKPLIGTVAGNVLAHGTGALNIDECRTPCEVEPRATPPLERASTEDWRIKAGLGTTRPEGRWPTNVVLDDSQADELDAQTGVLTSGANPTRRGIDQSRDAYGDFAGQETCKPARGADSGGASRFFPTFRYEAKAPTDERPRDGDVAHPTVKPLDLMRWLVRLVTPPDGVVLEPFAGSGTTAEACVIEGFRCIAVEREATYLPLIVARLSKPIQPDLFGGAA